MRQPAFGRLPDFDGLVFLVRIALPRKLDKDRIDHLATAGRKAAFGEIRFEERKQLLRQAMFFEALLEEAEPLGIGSSIPDMHAQKPPETRAAANLVLRLVIG